MAAGKMDQRITFQARAATSDGIGGQTLVWGNITTTPTVWAAVKVKRGGEQIDDGRMNARQIATFEIYNRSDLSEMNRILWGGEAWNIRNIQRSGGRRLTIIIEAERGAAS